MAATRKEAAVRTAAAGSATLATLARHRLEGSMASHSVSFRWFVSCWSQ